MLASTPHSVRGSSPHAISFRCSAREPRSLWVFRGSIRAGTVVVVVVVVVNVVVPRSVRPNAQAREHAFPVLSDTRYSSPLSYSFLPVPCVLRVHVLLAQVQTARVGAKHREFIFTKSTNCSYSFDHLSLTFPSSIPFDYFSHDGSINRVTISKNKILHFLLIVFINRAWQLIKISLCLVFSIIL